MQLGGQVMRSVTWGSGYGRYNQWKTYIPRPLDGGRYWVTGYPATAYDKRCIIVGDDGKVYELIQFDQDAQLEMPVCLNRPLIGALGRMVNPLMECQLALQISQGTPISGAVVHLKPLTSKVSRWKTTVVAMELTSLKLRILTAQCGERLVSSPNQ